MLDGFIELDESPQVDLPTSHFLLGNHDWPTKLSAACENASTEETRPGNKYLKKIICGIRSVLLPNVRGACKFYSDGRRTVRRDLCSKLSGVLYGRTRLNLESRLADYRVRRAVDPESDKCACRTARNGTTRRPEASPGRDPRPGRKPIDQIVVKGFLITRMKNDGEIESYRKARLHAIASGAESVLPIHGTDHFLFVNSVDKITKARRILERLGYEVEKTFLFPIEKTATTREDEDGNEVCYRFTEKAEESS